MVLPPQAAVATAEPRRHGPHRERVRRLAVGSVLARSFSIWTRNLAPFGLLALIVEAPLIAWRVAELLGVELGWLDGFAWKSVVQTALGNLLTTVISALALFGVLEELRGHHAPFASCVSRGLRGLRYALVASLVSFVIGAGFGLPALLFLADDSGSFMLAGIVSLIVVAPLLWLTIRLMVVVQSAALERTGLWASVRRSWTLTEGRAFTLFVISVVVGMLGGLLGWGSSKLSGTLGGTTGQAVSLVIVTVISTSFGAVMSAVIYHDLRLEVDGADTEELARVFA